MCKATSSLLLSLRTRVLVSPVRIHLLTPYQTVCPQQALHIVLPAMCTLLVPLSLALSGPLGSSLVLRLLLLLLPRHALRRSAHRPSLPRRRPCAYSALRLDIGPGAQVLLEVADGTRDEMVLLVMQGDDGHEAQREERPLGDDACGPVAAVAVAGRSAVTSQETTGGRLVLALRRHRLEALQLAVEVWPGISERQSRGSGDAPCVPKVMQNAMAAGASTEQAVERRKTRSMRALSRG